MTAFAIALLASSAYAFSISEPAQAAPAPQTVVHPKVNTISLNSAGQHEYNYRPGDRIILAVETDVDLAPHVVTNRLRANNWIYANLFANAATTNTTPAHWIKLHLPRFSQANQMLFTATIPESGRAAPNSGPYLSHAGELTFGSYANTSGQSAAGICPASAGVNCASDEQFQWELKNTA